MSGERRDTGVVASERGARDREHTQHFQRLAKMETQPRARAQLIELACQHEQIADINPREPSANLLDPRAGNNYGFGAVSPMVRWFRQK